jgi:4-amino-4-deoxy-L-arabinose transferase-like glycosyltransferase
MGVRSIMGREAEGVRDRSPLEVVPPGGGDDWLAPWVAQATMGFVVLGVLVRAVRYLLNYPLWCDEAMLAANFLDRGYADLLRPLDFRQVAPVLFLLLELTAVKLLGFSEMALRLFPFLCGIASVLLFRHVAGRVLGGVPLLLAVAVFAVSGWPLRYVAEVKPYASDLFVALAMLGLAVEWWRRPDRVGWLWALAVAAPLGVGFSYPAILVAGGIGLALAPSAWRSGRWDARLALAVYGVAAAATFVILLGTYKTAPQDHDYFHHDWAGAFPPLDGAARFAAWFLSINTGFMFAYPEGGGRGLSSVTFACFVVAAIVLWRRGRRTVLALGLMPFAMALIAAAMHRYPYGMSARTMQYAAPTICLFAGLGAAALLARFQSARARRGAPRVLVVALAALGLGRMGYDLSHPYKTATDGRARAFAQWFWTEKAMGAELACVKEDLGIVFQPGHWGHDATETYLCYQKIYSPRHRRGGKVRLDAVSPSHPLRCVLFNEMPQKAPAFRAWMADMLAKYDLRKFERYPVSSLERKKGQTWDSLYLIYEFVPKGSGPVPAVAGAPPIEAPFR